MALRSSVATTYDVGRTIQPIYTGGDVGLSNDGRVLVTCLGEEALLTDVDTGQILARVEGVSKRVLFAFGSVHC